MKNQPRTGTPLSSSLDASETNATVVTLTGPQKRLHARWLRDREVIILALRHGSSQRSVRRARRIDLCCFAPEVRQAANGQPVLVNNVCRDRLCPRCQVQRGQHVTRRIVGLTIGFNAPRFVTLTLSHKGESLRSMLDRLYEAFRKLRGTPFWKRHCRGGVYAVQVTRNTKEGEWHAHLHVIVDGEYMPQNQLSAAWLGVTGDSKVCDIRAVPDRAKIARYVAEYVSRPNEVAKWGWEAIDEYAEAMHGRRLVHTFGSAHGIKVEDEDDGAEVTAGTFVCDSLTLLKWRAKGDASADYVVSVLASLGPAWEKVFVDRTEAWHHGGAVPPDDVVAAAIATARRIYVESPNYQARAAPPPKTVQASFLEKWGHDGVDRRQHATG